ncbi:hypothetical protein BC834DRAFT_910993 [Gloeopeniophorella convolvens]|nr:hypothetical protein BC834DRAFT_910993 [Gloeopeniophorella convolvens]
MKPRDLAIDMLAHSRWIPGATCHGTQPLHWICLLALLLAVRIPPRLSSATSTTSESSSPASPSWASWGGVIVTFPSFFYYLYKYQDKLFDENGYMAPEI